MPSASTNRVPAVASWVSGLVPRIIENGAPAWMKMGIGKSVIQRRTFAERPARGSRTARLTSEAIYWKTSFWDQKAMRRLPIAAATLAKHAVIGGGPTFQRWSRFPVYAKRPCRLESRRDSARRRGQRRK